MTSEPLTHSRPNRVLRTVLQIPVLLYQIGLGPNLAKRGIMVAHTTGRRTGRERLSGLNYAVDENTVYVVAGWGERTDWYRNMQANPRVELQIGSQRLAAHARTVTDPAEWEKACRLLSAVDGGPPRPLRPVLARIGFDFDAEYQRAFADPSQLTVVALELVEPLAAEQPSRGLDRSRVAVLLFVAAAVAGFLLAVRRTRRK